jgi:hypothetical protein
MRVTDDSPPWQARPPKVVKPPLYAEANRRARQFSEGVRNAKRRTKILGTEKLRSVGK